MGSGTIRRRHPDAPVDYLAEFRSEEPRGGVGSSANEEARQAWLIDLEPMRSASEDADQARLIPLSAWPAPVVPAPLPPSRRFLISEDMSLLALLERAVGYGVSVREGAILGIAATAILAATVMAAGLLWQWHRTAQQAGVAALLTSAPATTSLVWQTPVALPTSPLRVGVESMRAGTPDVPLQSLASVMSPASVNPQRTAASASVMPTAATPPSAPTPTPPLPPGPQITAQDLTMPSATLYVAPPAATLAASLANLRPMAEPAAPSAATELAIHTAAIQGVLDRYRLAFNTLSVEGLGTVWRTVDTRALSRAFGQLEKQTVEFDACQIDITGELAEASCSGRTSFVPKVGAKSPRVDSRRWTFQLVRVRGGWVIDRVESR